jgi:hypothetical protein
MILIQGPDYVLSEKDRFDDTSRFDKLQKDSRQKIVDYFFEYKEQDKVVRIKILLAPLRYTLSFTPSIFISIG